MAARYRSDEAHLVLVTVAEFLNENSNNVSNDRYRGSNRNDSNVVALASRQNQVSRFIFNDLMKGDQASVKYVSRCFLEADIFSIDMCSMRRFNQ